MEIKRKKIIFIFLSMMLMAVSVLVLLITIPDHIRELDQCMIPEGCGPIDGNIIGNYMISLLLFIISGMLLLKYLPLKNKKRKK